MTTQLAVIESPPLIPDAWNYEESVAKVKILVYKWKNVTQEIIDELRIAREILRDVRNPNKNNVAYATLKTWNDYCQDIGVDRSTIHRWLALPHVAQNSGNNEWYTPQIYIEAAREVMGSIDTDPASSGKANEIVKAETYFTSEDDGRVKHWASNVWLNPPYAQPLVADFCELLVKKYREKEIQQACVLVNNATETTFYQTMLKTCSAVCFIKGRVRFVDEEGIESGAPLQGQTVLYFGSDRDRFAQYFLKFGVILYATC